MDWAEYNYTVDFRNDTHLYTSIVLVVISWLILLPTTLYHSNQYFLHRNHIILKKRYANITMFESILLCIKLFVIPLGFYFFFDASNVNIVWLFVWNISHFLALSLYWCWILRFFLLMYDIKWSLAIANNQWQQIINPHYKDKSLNWYLRNKKSFGQQSYVQYRIILPIIIISTLIIWTRGVLNVVVKQGDDQIDHESDHKLLILFYIFVGLHGFATILPLISLMIIRIKLPNSYYDNFYIISEIRQIFICVFIDEIIFLVVSFYFSFDKHSKNISDDMTTIITAIEILLIDLFQWLAVLIATKWVNKKILPIIQYKRYEIRKSSTTHYQPLIISQKDEILSLFTNDYHHNNNTPTHYDYIINQKKKIKLIQVLNKKKTFEIFMQHLSNELSLEICVALVELLQFRQCVILYVKYHKIKFEEKQTQPEDENTKKRKLILNYIKFPADIPLSETVFNIDHFDRDRRDNVGDSDDSDDMSSSNSSDDDSSTSRTKSKENSTILLNRINEQIVTISKNNGVIAREKYLQFSRIKFINTYKTIAYKLFLKYIAINAEYDIGIDDKIKNDISNVLNSNMDLFHLLHLFDIACVQVYSLLRKSFKRFKATPQWKKMKQCVSIQ